MRHDPMYITVEDPQDSGMTEIALALAMGFFSLMILTLLSMGAGDRIAARADNDRAPEAITVQSSEPRTELDNGDPVQGAPDVRHDLVIIYDSGRYLDATLTPIDPKAAVEKAEPGQRVVLAVDPDLPLGEIIAVREGLDRSGVVVTGYGTDWRERLKLEAGQ